VRIDRRRKMHATVLLRALGYTTQDLLNYFYSTETVFLEKGGKYHKSIEFDLSPGQRATRDIKVGSEVIVKKNTKFTRVAIRKLKEAKLDRLPVEPEELVGKVAAHDVVDPETGEVLVEVNEEVTLTSSSACARPTSTPSASSSSTGSTSAATCATRCSPTR
jgi:DNA-directed RNA polymerase subunit beta